MHLIIPQANVYTKARGLNFGPSLYQPPIFVCASSVASDEYLHIFRTDLILLKCLATDWEAILNQWDESLVMSYDL